MDRGTFAKGLAWTMIVNLINKAIFPLVSIIISRLLGPGPLGAFAVLSTIMAISEIFRDAGITQTFLADQEMDQAKARSYTALAVLMALIPALMLLGAKDWLAEVLELPELSSSLWVAAFALVANGLATIPRAQMLREAKIKELAIIDLISGGTGILLTIALVLAKFAFWALVIQLAYCSVLTLWLSHRQSPVHRLVWDGKAILESFRRTGSLLAANALNNLFLMADVFVIRRLLASNILLGLFGQGKNIAYKPGDFVTFPLTRMLIVAFSQSASDHAKLSRAVAKSLTATIMFVTPVYLILVFAAEPVIALLLGTKFAGSAPVLSAMSIFLAFRTVGTIGGTALVSYGKAKLTLVAQVVCLVVTISMLVSQRDQLVLPIFSSVQDYATYRSTELGGKVSRIEPAGAALNEVSATEVPSTGIVFALPSGTVAERVISDRGKIVPVADLGDWGRGQALAKPFGLAKLMAIVWSFVAGAVVLYSLILIMTLRLFPPPPADRIKLLNATGISVITGLLIIGLNLLPINSIVKLAILLVAVPLIHLLLLGMAFARKPTAYFSKAGLKQLWYEL